MLTRTESKEIKTIVTELGLYSWGVVFLHLGVYPYFWGLYSYVWGFVLTFGVVSLGLRVPAIVTIKGLCAHV